MHKNVHIPAAGGGERVEFYRIQDKIVSRQKIEVAVTRILEMRARGLSQQEVADRLQVDRTFVSRLEGLGEIRKGASIAAVGFPIQNKDEIRAVLEKGRFHPADE
ncbi:MAG: hypothetical protein NUV35_05110 [Syntrophomonadaceae bacterium]|nr:hypothetical protein [Syntrophomonadaceae bacterium]